ncbi:MAG: T9SS type A sorting domain-containing protein [Bacteroidetes bacterium]|nr:T9SS type A sorting domain-containing protein [Bacteroidota bacterium]
MKLKYLPVAVFLGAFALLLSSYAGGYTNGSGGDCRTGAVSSSVGCGQSASGCHGGTSPTTGITVSVELDSAGVPVNSYQPGGSYTVKMTAINTTSNNLPVFGFGLSSVTAAGAGTSATHQAGTWSSSLPNGVQNSIELSTALTTVIEHQVQLPKTSGTGTAGTTYVESIGWTAPAAGSGAIKLFAVINAADGDGLASSADKWNNTSATINEAGANAISEIAADLGSVNVYPTLLANTLTTAFDLRQDAKVSIELLSLNGQTVSTLLSQEAMNTGAQTRTFTVGDLSAGIYLVRVQAGEHTAISKVVKQ